MLSIGKVVAGQHRYYERQVAQGVDDYYSGRGEAPGWWAGTGADKLGLDGRVSGEQFNALVAGMDPRDLGVRLRSSPRDPKIAALHRLDDLDTQLIEVAATRAQCDAALEAIPAPPRRLLGRAPDPHVVDRHRPQSQIATAEDQFGRLTRERATLARELGDPEQARSELDGIDHEIAQLTEQHRSLRHELARREFASPAPWVARALGERPADHRAKDWGRGALHMAEYRVDHDVSDSELPLGPRPAGERERGEWERAQQTIEHGRQLLGRERDHAVELEIGF